MLSFGNSAKCRAATPTACASNTATLILLLPRGGSGPAPSPTSQQRRQTPPSPPPGAEAALVHQFPLTPHRTTATLSHRHPIPCLQPAIHCVPSGIARSHPSLNLSATVQIPFVAALLVLTTACRQDDTTADPILTPQPITSTTLPQSDHDQSRPPRRRAHGPA